MKNILFTAVTAITFLSISGCSDNKAYEAAVCALADVSGTYSREKQSMAKIIKAGLLPKMVPGDSMFLIAIDSNSYAEENLISKMTLDYRPTKVQQQKMEFSRKLDSFATSKMRSKHTDISGAMMLCADYLKDSKAGTQIMFVFSDMKEELPSGIKRKFNQNEFSGIDIAAMNVIKLGRDSANPQVYRKRLSSWKNRLGKANAKSWNNLMDSTKISAFIDSIRP